MTGRVTGGVHGGVMSSSNGCGGDADADDDDDTGDDGDSGDVG